MSIYRKISMQTALASARHVVRMALRLGSPSWPPRLRDVPVPVSSAFGKRENDTAAIVLNYKRWQNIEPIVRSILRAPSIGTVIISNHENAPRKQLFPHADPRVRILENPGRDSYYRYVVASEQPEEYFVAIDDDVLLTPTQLENLCACLRSDPSVPHGVCGQFRRKHRGFISGIVRHEGRIDVLNRVYAFTKSHAQAVVALHDTYWTDADNCFWDDILLSAVGAGKPQCHDVGDLSFCYTSRMRGIALCARNDFFDKREYAYRAVMPRDRDAEAADQSDPGVPTADVRDRVCPAVQSVPQAIAAQTGACGRRVLRVP